MTYNPQSKHIPFSALFLKGFILLFLNGCSLNSYTNKPFEYKDKVEIEAPKTKASFNIDPENSRGNKNKKSLLILALSGGGSRAAYWAGSIMLKLDKKENFELLKKVDVISSVSGGSLPAAYYAISRDSSDVSPNENQSRRIWDEETVKDLMSRSYLYKWVGNLAWPANIVKVTFTNYDRTDVMAQTLADNLFDTVFNGQDLSFADINPERPYLILNATNGTKSTSLDDKVRDCASSKNEQVEDIQFGNPFTFTEQDFKTINSDLASYSIARAVMATATFPGVFNDMTLYDYKRSDDSTGCKRYIHLFDGGNSDNLGLHSVKRLIKENLSKYENIAVISIDAYTDDAGWSSTDNNPRRFQGYSLDRNILHSMDSLLSATRNNQLDIIKKELGVSKKHEICHFTFEDVKGINYQLYKKINGISTDFNLDDNADEFLTKATDIVIEKQHDCLSNVDKLMR